jgi:hypothetical protein
MAVIITSASLALLLLLAGGAKLLQPKAFLESSMGTLIPTSSFRNVIPRILGIGELLLGAALVAAPSVLTIQVVAAGAFVFAAAATVVARLKESRLGGPARPCGCMASLGSNARRTGTLFMTGRPLLLAGVATANVVILTTSTPQTPGGDSSHVVVAVLLATAALGTFHLELQQLVSMRASTTTARCRLLAALRPSTPRSLFRHLQKRPLWLEMKKFPINPEPIETWHRGCVDYLVFALGEAFDHLLLVAAMSRASGDGVLVVMREDTHAVVAGGTCDGKTTFDQLQDRVAVLAL